MTLEHVSSTDSPTVKVTITKECMRDPYFEFYLLEIESSRGAWLERASLSELSLCLRLLRAGVEMAGGELEEIKKE